MHTTAPLQNNKKHLTTMSVLFFLFFAGIGVFFTYLNVYYASIGFTGMQIGLITTVAALTGIPAATLWGYLTDRTGQVRLIMAGGSVLTAVIALLIPLTTNFYLLMVLTALFALGNTAVFTLIDSTTLTLLGERREDYGKYRLGGSFGYILTTLSAGFIFERLGLQWMFPAYSVIAILYAVIALRLPVLTTQHSQGSKGSLWQMVRRPSWIVFSVCVFLVWIAASGSITFLGMSIRTMGGTDSLIGIAATMAALVEIPFMFFSGMIMRRLGHQNLLWISMLAFTLRIGLYGFMPDPAWVIGINTLNGLSFVFFWNSSINYANEIAPDSLKATAQGLFQAIISLASVASALLSGWMFDQLGPSGLFRLLAVGCLAAFLIFSVSRFRQLNKAQAKTAA